MRFEYHSRKTLWYALIIAFFTASAAYILTASMQWRADQELNRMQTLHMESILSSYYEQFGSWEKAIPVLESSALLADKDLQIWSQENERVWPAQSDYAQVQTGENILNRQLILLHGQIIGSYSGLMNEQVLDSSYSLLFSILLGLIVGAAVYLMVWYRERSGINSMNHIIQNLKGLLPETRNSISKKAERAAATLYFEQSKNEAEQLIGQMKERLFRLETIRKSMVADIAHELRTPLAVLRTKLDQALQNQKELDLPQLALLQDEVYRMSKLLSDLQQLSLSESGHLILEKTWFPMRELLEEIAALLVSEPDGIAINWQVKSDYHVYADQNRIKQVIVNLLGNALKYAKSCVSISVVFEQNDCVVTISDDGAGIEEEELPYLFERFYRGTVNRRDNSASSGLGLGLPIVKSLLEAHHGTITVSSKWQKGTSFQLKFPVFYEET